MVILSGISSLNKCEIITLSDSISVALSEGLDNDDLSMLGNLLMSIGSNIVTYASIKPKSCKTTDQMSKGKPDKNDK